MGMLNRILAESILNTQKATTMQPVVYILNLDVGGLSDIIQVLLIRTSCSDWRTHYDIRR